MRDLILSEIRRIAAASGEPPGQMAFRAETGIPAHKWRGVFWARWGDALVEAGFAPKPWNQRLDSQDLLRKIAQVTRNLGHLPTRSELDLLRKSDPSVPTSVTANRHFSGQGGIIEALRSLGNLNEEFSDLTSLLPAAKQRNRVHKGSVKHGYVYLIQWERRYKIGRSDDPGRALSEIRAQLPTAAAIIHTIQTDDPVGIEAYWHRRFAERRLRGEWFDLSVTDVKAFTRRKFQ